MGLSRRSSGSPTAFCAHCGKDVAFVTRAEAAELIEMLDLDLERLAQYGLVHLLDADRVCKPSLFARNG